MAFFFFNKIINVYYNYVKVPKGLSPLGYTPPAHDRRKDLLPLTFFSFSPLGYLVVEVTVNLGIELYLVLTYY